MTRRWGYAGLVIAVAYLAIVCVSIAQRDDHVRPLYDGLTPQAPYQYVEPPVVVAAENIEPAPISTTIDLDAGESKAAGISTPDGQFVVNLARGAVAPAAGATAVAVRITPLDPHKLGALPGTNMNALGNAYRLEMAYQPSGAAVTRLAKPGTLFMEVPDIAQRAFVSTDGEQWSQMPAEVQQPARRSLTAELRAPGYFVAGTDGPTLAFRTRKSSHAALVVGLVVVLVALVLFLGVYLVKGGKQSSKSSKPKAQPKKSSVSGRAGRAR